MADKPKRIGDKKIGGVKSTTETGAVEGTESVGGVGGVKATAPVSGVKRSGGIGASRLTGSMSAAEREQLFRMITEEADKLAAEGGIPKKRREVVEKAVRMAVEAGIVIEDEPPGSKPSKK